MKILFFGSTTDSVLVLQKLFTLHSSLFTPRISAVVTQPPRPVGRDKTITPTPVETWANTHNVTVLSFPTNPNKPWAFADEQQVIDTLQPVGADILISASYGVKIPWETIRSARYGGINIHPSILPNWRGADPVPWAILSGDHQTGITVVTLSETFDEGKILAQEKIPITPHDTSDPLRTKLFEIGADLLVSVLPACIEGKLKPVSHKDRAPNKTTKLPYARKFTREDGFEPWERLLDPNESERINRKFRALHPWPGVWTRLPSLRPSATASPCDAGRDSGIGGQALNNKRLKILEFTHAPITVQVEGKKPVSWEQFRTAYMQG